MTEPMPPKLAAALVAVAREVKQLGKSERNKFANYDFVSVDKFYSAIGSIMADKGVLCIPDCIDSEVVPGNVKTDNNGNQRQGAPLLRERWAFTLIHESGETYESPVHRTVTVPAEGAQAHGSSESYAQKQFLRGVFRVPTGDKDDADYQKAETHGVAPASQRKSAAQAKRDGDAETVKRMLTDASTAEDLDARWQVVQSEWLPILPEKWEDVIHDFYLNARDALKAKGA
jgi:hypothetical protein